MLGNILGAIAGPLIGGLLGGSKSASGGGERQTATKEPWAEAAPWLKNQIAQGQQLQDYYQKNPFNSQQQTAYQNTFNDLDSFRNQTAPGLMQFANNAMTGAYQRQPVSRPGMGSGYGGQAPQNQTPGGLLASGQGPFSVAPQPASQPMRMGGFMGGLLGVMDGSMFQPKQTSSQYGQVDFGAINPFTNGHMSQMEAKRLADADLEAKRLAMLQAQQIQQGYGNGYGGFGGDAGGGGGDGGSSGPGTAGNAGADGDSGPGGVGGW